MLIVPSIGVSQIIGSTVYIFLCQRVPVSCKGQASEYPFPPSFIQITHVFDKHQMPLFEKLWKNEAY
jgi:hypothetical protein